MNRFKSLPLAAVAGVLTLMLAGCGDADKKVTAEFIGFGEITTGSNSLYHEQANGSLDVRNDLSGTANSTSVNVSTMAVTNTVVFVDDGGKPSEFNYLRATEELPDTDGIDIEFTDNHQDLEGATWSNGYYVATTSWSLAAFESGSGADATSDEAYQNYNRLTRFKLDFATGEIFDELTVGPYRNDLMVAMDTHFDDTDWFTRAEAAAAKSGGLNIEGLSRTNVDDGTLVFGIRSPLYSAEFGDGVTDLNYSMGEAILAFVSDPFGTPGYTFETLDLDVSGDAWTDADDNLVSNHGVRGMEWIPAMNGYVIIGGTTKKVDGAPYSLWLWNPTSDELSQIDADLTGFDQLCRPESVIQMKEVGKSYLVVLSEESGGACDADPDTDDMDLQPFTYIKAEIVHG